MKQLKTALRNMRSLTFVKNAEFQKQTLFKPGRELSFFYVLVISIVIHLFIFSFIVLPYHYDPQRLSGLQNSIANSTLKEVVVRGIIVNINPDNQVVETERTMLSDVDSAAKGFLTEQKGDNWLNNSLSFMPQQSAAARESARKAQERQVLLARNQVEYTIDLFDENEFIPRPEESVEDGEEVTPDQDEAQEQEESQKQVQTVSEWGRIPDKKGITLENAIYYSNTRRFSFNTKKFKDFEYFRQMKQKIANHWFPPIMANSLSTGYIPGRTSVRVIASQEVRTYFVLNRQGDVMKVVLVDSRGNTHLDESCLDAIRNSKTFGPVPDDIPGEEVVIPFIFGYYVR